MPFKGFASLFGFKKKQKQEQKVERVHPYDEVDEQNLKDNQQNLKDNKTPKRRPRMYDEIEIDDDASGPTMVDNSSRQESKRTLNYVEVDVQPQNPDAEIRRSAPPTQYTTIDVAATSGGRKISISD